MWRFSTLLFLILSCTTHSELEQVNLMTLSPTGSRIILKREPGQHPFPGLAQNILENPNQIALYDRLGQQILTYPLNGGDPLNRLPLQHYTNNDHVIFTVLNNDEAWVSYNPAKRAGYNHDSTFLQINATGVIKEVFPMHSLPVSSQVGMTYRLDRKYYNFQSNSRLIHDSLAILDLVSWDVGFGDSIFHDKKLLVGALFNLNSRIVSQIRIRPAGKKNHYYPKRYRKPYRTMGHDGSIIYSFSHLNEIYKYNIHSSQVSRYSTYSSLFDTIYPLEPNYLNTPIYERPSHDKTQSQYQELYYFPKQHIYLRIFQSPEIVDNQSISNPRFGYIAMDTTFEKLGEGFLPPDYWFTQIHHDDEIVLYHSASPGDSTIEFEIFELEQMPIAAWQFDSILESERVYLKPGGILAYLKEQHDWTEHEANILFVPIGRICMSCQESVLGEYRRLVLEGSDLKLVIAGQNISEIEHTLDEAGLSSDTLAFNSMKMLPINSILKTAYWGD